MNQKTNFKSFEIGTIFNNCRVARAPQLIVQNEITIHYPARLEAMALDPAKITENNNLIYTAGQIDFCVSLYKHVTVQAVSTNNAITITDKSDRKALIEHAALLMKQALGYEGGLIIDVNEDAKLRHCGLGSSSGLIAAVASAINELFSRPIDPQDLVMYCAQNHGEEIDGNNNELIPVQCIGGSAVSGNYVGGLIILSGQATPIMQVKLPKELKVVIGVPTDFTHPDSKELMEKEEENMSGFLQSGQLYGQTIAYRLIHDVMPALMHGSLNACKQLIFDYRWDMGSIENCSFVLPRITDIAERLRPLQHDSDVEVISLSSVGPGFFALTRNTQKIEQLFEGLDMKILTTTIHNDRYTVELKEIEHA
jgi:predicted sugar kinase